MKSKPRSLMRDVVDMLPIGVMILRRGGQIVFANAAAQEILSDGRFLIAKNKTLTATSLAHNRALQEAIHATSSDGLVGPLTFSRSRPGLPPISVAIMPIKRATRSQVRNLLLFVSDPARSHQPDISTIGLMFGFTRAEAMVARELVGGKDVADIAKSQSLSTHTVRSHMKGLLSKTNSRKQVEFVGTLLRSPAVLNYESLKKTVEPDRKINGSAPASTAFPVTSLDAC